MGAAGDLRQQWSVPSDILSLLLLIGGDIVQKAIAQLVGYVVAIPCRRRIRIQITPAAFSFGWAAYSFANLLSAVGDMRLMPVADCPVLTVNCSNGFVRETRCWVLGRILRDHKIRYPTNRAAVARAGRRQSIRIDIFYLGPAARPSTDLVWWSGWATLLLQIGVAAIPGALSGAWEAMLITICGAVLVAVTCAMPQWSEEKWAARTLERQKVTCITQGNGSSHIIVFIGLPGAWDLESLSTGESEPRPETRWLSLLLVILWVCLLITIAGVKQHTWYLVAIGGLGMLQNVFAAGAVRGPAAFGFQLRRFAQAPTIIGYPGSEIGVADDKVDLSLHEEELRELDSWVSGRQDSDLAGEMPPKMPAWMRTMTKDDGVPSWLECSPSRPETQTQPKSRFSWRSTVSDEAILVKEGVGVHGALIELEKWVPSAGLAMMQIFFPGGLKYNEEAIRDNVHKRFWKAAYHTETKRRKAAEKLRGGEEDVVLGFRKGSGA